MGELSSRQRVRGTEALGPCDLLQTSSSHHCDENSSPTQVGDSKFLNDLTTPEKVEKTTALVLHHIKPPYLSFTEETPAVMQRGRRRSSPWTTARSGACRRAPWGTCRRGRSETSRTEPRRTCAFRRRAGHTPLNTNIEEERTVEVKKL